MMQTITFECEVITPMFLAGADGQKPELRAPSIKGALRFWWRAMNGHLPLTDLQKKETEIFGGTSGDSGQRSKVIIRVNTREQEVGDNYKEKIWDNTMKKPKSGFEGVAYLYYSVLMQQKPYYEKAKFSVTFSSREEKYLIDTAFAFWLMCNLGGLGSRSRRLAGNFAITNFSSSITFNKFNFLNSNKSFEGTLEYLKENLDIIKKAKGINPINSESEFCSLASCQIFLLKNFSTNKMQLVNTVGNKFREFRDHKPAVDYSTIKNYLLTGRSSSASTLEKSVFGLPIAYRYGSIYTRRNAPEALIQPNSKDNDRSASSLIFSIVKSDTNYYPLLINFNSKLLPNEIGLMISDKTKKKVMEETGHRRQNDALISKPVNTLKSDFISTLPNQRIL